MIETELLTKKRKTKDKTNRIGKELKIHGQEFGNPNLSFKIGTVDHEECPQTIYIIVTFWVDIENKEQSSIEYDRIISKKYDKELKNIYKIHLKPKLEKNNIFPLYYDNISLCEFPENLNYNNKKSFTSIELNLHTKNCMKSNENSVEFKNETNNVMFAETIEICKIIANTPVLKGETGFIISKEKK